MRKLDEKKYKDLLEKAKRNGGNFYGKIGVPSGVVYALQQFVYDSTLHTDSTYEDILCHLEYIAQSLAILPVEKINAKNRYGAMQFGLFSMGDVEDLDSIIGTGVWTKPLSEEDKAQLIGKYLYADYEVGRVNSNITNPVKSVNCHHGRCFVGKHPYGSYIFDKKEIKRLIKNGKFVRKFFDGSKTTYFLTSEEPYDYYVVEERKIPVTDITDQWLDENGFHLEKNDMFLLPQSHNKTIGGFRFYVRTYKEGCKVAHIDGFKGNDLYLSTDVDTTDRMLKLIDLVTDDQDGAMITEKIALSKGFNKKNVLDIKDLSKSIHEYSVRSKEFSLYAKFKDDNKLFDIRIIPTITHIIGCITIKTERQLNRLFEIFDIK